jgi:hypothetical protein
MISKTCRIITLSFDKSETQQKKIGHSFKSCIYRGAPSEVHCGYFKTCTESNSKKYMVFRYVQRMQKRFKVKSVSTFQ